MAIYSEINEGIVTKEGSSLEAKANVSFQAVNDVGVKITQTIDRPGELYYNGEEIIFYITITRMNGVTDTINKLTITDDFPSIVSYSEANVEHIEGTSGKVSVVGQLLTISDLVLNNGKPTITYKITGTITIA